MSGDSKKATRSGKAAGEEAGSPVDGVGGEPAPRPKANEYEQVIRRLQGELVVTQQWVKATGAKICIASDGLDSAGKAGTIRRITGWASWDVAHNDHKKRGRLNTVSHLLSQVPYQPLPTREVSMAPQAAARGILLARTASAPHPGTVLNGAPTEYPHPTETRTGDDR